MKKILAVIMALVMMVLPVCSMADAGTDLLEKENANGKNVTSVLGFVAGDLSLIGDEQMATVIADLANNITLEIGGQDNMMHVAAYMGGETVAAAALEFTEDAVYINSDWLPTQLVITGEDVRTLVVDYILPMIKANGGEDAASLLELVEPVLTDFDYTFHFPGFIKLFEDMKAFEAELDALVEQVAAVFEGSFPRTEAVALQYCKVATVNGAAYGVDGDVQHVVLSMDIEAMKNVLNAVCDDLNANETAKDLFGLLMTMVGADASWEEVVNAIRSVYAQGLDMLNMTVEADMVLDMTGTEMIAGKIAYVMSVEDQQVSEVIEMATAYLEDAKVVNVKVDVTMGITNVMTMTCMAAEALSDGATAFEVTVALNEALTGIADGNFTISGSSTPSIDEEGNVNVYDDVSLTLGAGFGGKGEPIATIYSVSMSAAPYDSFASADAVHVLAITEDWLAALQETASSQLMNALQALPESVRMGVMN